MAARRLLGVFAHPDDETYSAGGLFALSAAAGVDVEILCATRGEAGGVRDASMLGAGGIGALRATELEASCAALGAEPPRFLDWPDGGVAAVDPAVRSAQIAAHLDRFAPQVVVTLGTDGAYGHADHVAVTDSVVAALTSRPALGARLLLCQFPRGLFGPLLRIMRKLGVALADGVGPNSLGVDLVDVDLVLQLAEEPGAQAAKLNAIAAHRSQRPTDDPRSFLLPDLIDPLLEQEWYTVAAGPPLPISSTDPFAGM